jgi:hypothetical protein
MGGPRHTVAGAVLLALVAGCGSLLSPSSSPVTSSPPSGTPTTGPTDGAAATASPSASPTPIEAWTHETDEIRGLSFADDGTAYVFTWSGEAPSRVVALDPGGAVMPGWPQEIGSGSTGIGWGPAVAPDDSILVLAFAYTGDDLTINYSLHRYAPDGSVVEGWPYVAPSGDECGAGLFDDEGRVLLACGTESGGRVVALDSAGETAWESAIDLPLATEIRLGSGGRIYVGSPNSAGGLAALDPNGDPVAGWPIRIDEPYAFDVAPTGAVVVRWRDHPAQEICNEGGSTVYLAIAEDGGVLPGWPMILAGPASMPAFDRDGTVYVTDAADRLFAVEPDGSVPSGWPAVIPGTTGTCFGPPDPVVGPDGTVFVGTGRAPPAGSLTAVSPDGAIVDGWPYLPDGELAYPCVGCTPGPGDPSPPLIDGDRIFVATFPGGDVGGVAIVSLARDGSMRAGWPLRVDADEAALHLAPDGRLFAVLVDVDDLARTRLQFIPDPPPDGSGG